MGRILTKRFKKSKSSTAKLPQILETGIFLTACTTRLLTVLPNAQCLLQLREPKIMFSLTTKSKFSVMQNSSFQLHKSFFELHISW